MKTTVFIVGGVVVVVVLGVLIFMQLGGSPDIPLPVDDGGTTFPAPVDDPAREKAVLTGRSGSSIEVRNFLNDSTTVKDPQNVGYYNLGYHNFDAVTNPPATNNPSYTITFIAGTQFFNVSLYKEPIGVVRKEAERYLIAALGVEEKQLCDLKYTVATPIWVNEAYAGQDLKFSFCPGSTPLSE